MLGSGLNLITTVIGFGMSATFIVFVCARLVCGRIRPSDSRAAAFDIELRADFDPPEHTIHGLEPVGLEPVAVAAIPTIKYNHEAFHSREDAQCSICLGDYEEKEMLRIMPSCRHNFHLACIDVWLQKQSTCPICRLPLNDSFEAKCAAPPLFGVQPTMGGPESSGNHSRHSVHRGQQQSGGSENNPEIHESLSAVIGAQRGEERELST